METERRYGRTGFSLGVLEELAHRRAMENPRLLLDLIARIRELETERAELDRMDVEIRAWEEADHDNPLARTWEISGHDGIVWWHWDNGTIGGHGNRGQTETIIDAIRALYDDLVRQQEDRTMTDPRRSLAALRYLAVVVSFAHMAATILLYSSHDWYAQAVAGGMTLLIDLVTIRLIEYRIAATWRVSRWITGFLALSLTLSVALNGVYLWRYRPNDVDASLSVAIVAALAVFVPGWIAVSATMHAEWTRHTATPAPRVRQRPATPRQLPATTGDTVTLAATTDKPVSRRTLQRRAKAARERQTEEPV